MSRLHALRRFLLPTALVSGIIALAYIQGGLLEEGVIPAIAAELRAMANGFNPNFAVFAQAPLVIQIHILAAMGALVIGTVQLIGPKGTLPHRTLGYGFAGLMLITVITAIFIRNINDGAFSLIHIFVPLTLMGLFGMIVNARKMQTDRHRSAVFGLFFGALILPGVFAFVPGRLMWQMFFGG